MLHANNGGPTKGAMKEAMKEATMLSPLQRLGIVPSFSRPHGSDDNPFAETLLRAFQYCPEYPTTGFASVELAHTADSFVIARALTGAKGSELHSHTASPSVS